MKQEPQRLPLERIRLDGGTQMRVRRLIDDAIDGYVERLREGDTFPPVVVYYDGTDYWLADGFQRHEAHRLAGFLEIDCEVRKGTVRDAKEHALGANEEHGIRRTREDKRNAVLEAFKLCEERLAAGEIKAPWSDNLIAQKCKVSQPFVGSLRPAPTYNVISDARTGADGRVINTAAIRARTPTPEPTDTLPLDVPAHEPPAVAWEPARTWNNPEPEPHPSGVTIECEPPASLPSQEPPSTFTCTECGDIFSLEVWHCPACAHHWSTDLDDTCRNCWRPRDGWPELKGEQEGTSVAMATTAKPQDPEVTAQVRVALAIPNWHALNRHELAKRTGLTEMRAYTLLAVWKHAPEQIPLLDTGNGGVALRVAFNAAEEKRHAKTIELGAGEGTDPTPTAETATSNPFLGRRDWNPVLAVQANSLLNSLDEFDRTRAIELVTQPGVPPSDAMSILQQVAAMSPQARARTWALASSEDRNDREVALTVAAGKPCPVDLRTLTLKEWIAWIGRMQKEYPNCRHLDRWNQLRDELRALCEALQRDRKETISEGWE